MNKMDKKEVKEMIRKNNEKSLVHSWVTWLGFGVIIFILGIVILPYTRFLSPLKDLNITSARWECLEHGFEPKEIEPFCNNIKESCEWFKEKNYIKDYEWCTWKFEEVCKEVCTKQVLVRDIK